MAVKHIKTTLLVVVIILIELIIGVLLLQLIQEHPKPKDLYGIHQTIFEHGGSYYEVNEYKNNIYRIEKLPTNIVNEIIK